MGAMNLKTGQGQMEKGLKEVALSWEMTSIDQSHLMKPVLR